MSLLTIRARRCALCDDATIHGYVNHHDIIICQDCNTQLTEGESMKSNMIDVRVGNTVIQVTSEQAGKIERAQSARQRRLSQFLAHDNTIERLGNPGNQLAGWMPSDRSRQRSLSNAVRTRYNVTPAHEHQHEPTMRICGRTIATAAA